MSSSAAQAGQTAVIEASYLGVFYSIPVSIVVNPYDITLTADPEGDLANGTATVDITATIIDSLGNPVPAGTSVRFDTTAGTFVASSYIELTTDALGVATATLTIDTLSDTDVTVTVTAGGMTEDITITIGTP